MSCLTPPFAPAGRGLAHAARWLVLLAAAGSSLPGFAQTISRAEYFIDTDPGLGAATALTASSANTFGTTIALTGLATGLHQLGVRSLDSNNDWSLTNRRVFYYEPVPVDVVAAEYTLDTEALPGSGTAIPVTPGLTVSIVNFPINMSTLTAGLHILSVRTRDAVGTWSLTNRRAFYYEPNPVAGTNIDRAEFFFDTDPGFGSAPSALAFTPAPDVPSLPLGANAGSLADGTHRIFFRTRDASNRWSLVNSRSFVKSGCGSSLNFGAGLLAAAYTTGGSAGGPVELAFNTDPATPGSSTAPYASTNGYLQVDLGTARTLGEVRTKLTPSVTGSYSLRLQTATSLAGPYTNANPLYTATLTANTTTAVALPLTTTVANVRAIRLVLTAPTTSAQALFSGTGVYYFDCAGASIASLSPLSGPVGTAVTLTGTNLGGATLVTFGGQSVPFTSNTATGLSFTVPAGLAPGAYTVVVTTPNGASNSFTFTVTGVTAARAALGQGTLEVFPNPAQREFVVRLPALAGAPSARFTLLNSLGQVVQAREMPLSPAGTDALVDVRGLAPGLYTVRVQVGGLAATRQVAVE